MTERPAAETAAMAGEGRRAPLILHASCVAFGGHAVLILGASGRGKSGLALQLMGFGAELVADDRTCLWRQDGAGGPQVMADAPETLRGLIEARGVGILKAAAAGPVPVNLVVDLDQIETSRLPPLRRFALLDVDMPLVHMVDTPAFPAAILQYLRQGRRD
jgi:HPr kinase/phosphorylase